MIIEEFSIQRYGPIKGLTIRNLKKFNLFFGLNESGKTLTIDAIVKLLTGSNKARYFESIDRVSEKPEGYLVIKCEKSTSNKNNKNIIKLPDMGSLTKHKDLNNYELRNIFIIRDSDLTITKEDEFYTNITDKLTGLNTKYISIIKEKLLNIGKLTPSGEFKDIKGEKLNSRIKNANLLLERDIKELEKYSRDNNLFDIEEKKVSKKEELDEIEQKIKELEDARLREMYEKTKNAFERVNYLLTKLKNSEIYNDTIMQSWIEYEKNIALLSERKAKLIEELRGNKKKLDEITNKLDSLRKEMKILEEKKKDIDDNIRFELKRYNEENNNFMINKKLNRFITYSLIVSSIISAISIIGIILKDSLSIEIILIIFLFISFTCGFFKFRLIREKAKLETKFNDINIKLSKYSLGGKKIDDILVNIQRFNEIYKQKYDETSTLTSKKEALAEYIKATDKDIKETDNKINNIKKEVEKIKFEYACDNIVDYKEKLNVKRILEKELAEEKSILNSYLNSSSKNLEENLKFWDKEITKLEKYRDKARGVNYSVELILQLKTKKETLVKQLDCLNEKTKTLNERLNNITRQANDILKVEGEDILYCNYLTDIEVIKDKIIKFINKNKYMKEKVFTLKKIFDEIEVEEREKVLELFGENSSVTSYFQDITDNMYKEVFLDRESSNIQVLRNDGETLSAHKLSGGTYDQLYFSIRIALGEKLLKDEKGFFIIDDPFIKSDSKRLKNQISMLKKIADYGWQVLFFTAKEEVRDVLKNDIRENHINYINLNQF